MLVFSDSRDKASRLAANLQNDINLTHLERHVQINGEQFTNPGKVKLSDVYYGFLYCSVQNLRFSSPLQAEVN